MATQPRRHCGEMDAPHLREGYAPGNGLRLHYVEWGERDAPVVLLLHGLGGYGRIWEPVARLLAGRFRCIAPDARGHGLSDWAGAGRYVSDEHFADLPELLDALGVAEVAVCGHSMGSAAAIQFAACLPERCWALAVVDAYPDPEPSAGSEQIARFYAGLPDSFPSREAALRAAALFGLSSARDAFDTVMRPLDGGAYAWRQDPGIRDELRDWLRDGAPVRRVDLWPFWRAVRAPALVVRGSRSAVLSEEMARRMVQELPGTRLVELPAGHAVPLERPRALAEVLDGFLAEARPKREPLLE